MPMAFTERGPIFFVHVPKTGGTSVEDYLRRRFGSLALDDVNKREKVPGTGLISAVNHLSATDLREMIPEQSILVFAIVRNPLDRILSEYRWQQGASRMSHLSFSTWLRAMERCHKIDRRTYDNHIRPQDDLVPPEAEVFKLEAGLELVAKRIDEVTQGKEQHLSFRQLKPTQKKGIEIKISREDVSLVQKLYARDYDRFGYPFHDLSAFPQDPRSKVRAIIGYGLGTAVVFKQRRDWLR